MKQIKCWNLTKIIKKYFIKHGETTTVRNEIIKISIKRSEDILNDSLKNRCRAFLLLITSIEMNELS